MGNRNFKNDKKIESIIYRCNCCRCCFARGSACCDCGCGCGRTCDGSDIKNIMRRQGTETAELEVSLKLG